MSLYIPTVTAHSLCSDTGLAHHSSRDYADKAPYMIFRENEYLILHNIHDGRSPDVVIIDNSPLILFSIMLSPVGKFHPLSVSEPCYFLEPLHFEFLESLYFETQIAVPINRFKIFLVQFPSLKLLCHAVIIYSYNRVHNYLTSKQKLVGKEFLKKLSFLCFVWFQIFN